VLEWRPSYMLRHACGFALANKGHDIKALQAYLGHKNIQFPWGLLDSGRPITHGRGL